MQAITAATQGCISWEVFPGAGWALVRLSEGGGTCQPGPYLSQPCAMRRWLQLGGSYSPVSVGRADTLCEVPATERAGTDGKWSLFSLESFPFGWI